MKSAPSACSTSRLVEAETRRPVRRSRSSRAPQCATAFPACWQGASASNSRRLARRLSERRPPVASCEMGMSPDSASRRAEFYFEPDFDAGGSPCPCVVVLIGPRWNRYLRGRIGISGPAFFERPALDHEPNTFPSGHPFAWVYRRPDEVLLDERRWMTAADHLRISSALEGARYRSCGRPELPRAGEVHRSPGL